MEIDPATDSWSRGYDVAFTRRRSPVQIRLGPPYLKHSYSAFFQDEFTHYHNRVQYRTNCNRSDRIHNVIATIPAHAEKQQNSIHGRRKTQGSPARNFPKNAVYRNTDGQEKEHPSAVPSPLRRRERNHSFFGRPRLRPVISSALRCMSGRDTDFPASSSFESTAPILILQ